MAFYGVSQYRAAYRSGALSPVQAVGDHLQCAKALSKSVNAVSAVDPAALAQAEDSAARYRAGEGVRPLEGMPVIVKDSYHVKGLPRWHGTAVHPGAVSDHDSEPIARLREAGAIVAAKGTMPDMGMLASGLSSQFGIVRNPWDPAMSPGGSSSGVAAALASGAFAFGLGTDIAGSVRLPAGHCGLAAIKPTQGRIAYSPASTMRSSGVMARSVADVVAGLMAVGRAAATDPWCLPGRFEPVPFEAVAARLPRVGVVCDMGYGTPAEPVVTEAVHAAALRLERAGFRAESVSPGLSDADFDNADLVFKAHAAAEVRASERPAAVLPLVASWLEGADAVPMADYEDAMAGLLATVGKLQARLGAYDFLISPVVPVAGFPAESPGPGDETQLLHHASFTAWFNQTCQPAAVYRETDDAARCLPVGVQVVGRRFDDAGVLAVAQYLESTRESVAPFPCLEGVPSYEDIDR